MEYEEDRVVWKGSNDVDKQFATLRIIVQSMHMASKQEYTVRESMTVVRGVCVGVRTIWLGKSAYWTCFAALLAVEQGDCAQSWNLLVSVQSA